MLYEIYVGKACFTVSPLILESDDGSAGKFCGLCFLARKSHRKNIIPAIMKSTLL